MTRVGAGVHAAFALGAFVTGCKDAPPRGAVTALVGSGSSTPSSLALPSGPLAADVLITAVFTKASGPVAVLDIAVNYVRADGIIDAKYGEANFDFAKIIRPPDDSKRPIGAPVDEPRPAETGPTLCPQVSWHAGTLTEDASRICPEDVGFAERPACTIVQLWRRAIDDGAPANALAKFAISAGHDWVVSIDDDPRQLHFKRLYPDAGCAKLAESDPRPLPAEAGSAADPLPPIPSDPDGCDEVSCVINGYAGACCQVYRPKPAGALPETPDRSEILTAVNAIRPKIKRCAEPTVNGTVKVAVTVAPDGSVSNVVVKDTPKPSLGTCVANQLRGLELPATRRGVTFSFPFVFTAAERDLTKPFK